MNYMLQEIDASLTVIALELFKINDQLREVNLLMVANSSSTKLTDIPSGQIGSNGLTYD